MDKYYCSDLTGLFLILAYIRPEKINYINCTNTYAKLNANIPRPLLETVFESLPVTINIIDTKCYVPPLSKRFFGFIYHKRLKVNGKVFCMSNTLPLLKSKDTVRVIYDPQSLAVNERNFLRNKNNGYFKKIISKLKRKFHPTILGLDLIEPAHQYRKFYHDFEVLKKDIDFKIIKNNSYEKSIQGLRKQISGELDRALTELHNHKPDFIYLPSAELSDEQTFDLFNFQLSQIPQSSRIYIKNHPRDKRDYLMLFNQASFTKRITLITPAYSQILRILPLEIVKCSCHYAKLFGQISSTHWYLEPRDSLVIYAYPEPLREIFRDEYKIISEIGPHQPPLNLWE